MKMLVAILLLFALCQPLLAKDVVPFSKQEHFQQRILPALKKHCYSCHSTEEKHEAGLFLDSRYGWENGGERGPAIQPKRPDESLLIQAIRYENSDLQMPPDGKLPTALVDDFEKWVRTGAFDIRERKLVPIESEFNLAERMRFWCFQPVRHQRIPEVQNGAWVVNDVDAFILSRLEQRNLTPAKVADRQTLIRRVSFDLTGLPPTPGEVDQFLNDGSPYAYTAMVSRYLQSSHFGERWARHWMDLVRYAETRGHEFDGPFQVPYVYRDYLIRAFNADVPYDQIVREHIAGDLLPNPRHDPISGVDESFLGTAFYSLGEGIPAPVDVRQDAANRIDNIIEVISKTFMGLTVSCARCHDHKFDAIATRDYYALYGMFDSTRLTCRAMNHIDDVAAILPQLDQIKTAITQEVASVWKADAERVADYLEMAKQGINLEANRVDAWVGFLNAENKKKEEISKKEEKTAAVEPVLEGWRLLLLAAQKSDTELVRTWNELEQRVANERKHFTERVQSSAHSEGLVELADFRSGSYGDWLREGDAFSPKPGSGGKLILSEQSDEFIQGVETPGAFSGQSSRRRLGALRSPVFTIDRKELYFRVKGSGTVRIVPETLQIHHSLQANCTQRFQSDTFEWLHVKLPLLQGTRAYVEIVHGDFDSSKGVFTAPTNQYLGVDRILFQTRSFDYNVRPASLDWQLPPLAPNNPEQLFAALQQQITDTVSAWADGQASSQQFTLINALIRQRLLPVGNATTPQLRELAQSFQTCAQTIPLARIAWGVTDGPGHDQYIFIRGNYATPVRQREYVPRRYPQALVANSDALISDSSRTVGSGRRELAEILTDSKNPLSARVMVNRIWHHLFGRGIVASTDNFGKLGERPSHPELLDYLANRFVQDRWSIKRMISFLVGSQTYRMSSRSSSKAQEIDPGNVLLQSMRVRRLQGEAIRDAMLAVSGRLDRSMYGPSIAVHLTPQMQGRGRPESGPLDGGGRRSVYISICRNFLSPMMLTFDVPIPFSSFGRRNVTQVPAQSLVMMNHPFVVQQSRVWARRELAESKHTTDERITEMFQVALAREPTRDERRMCKQLLILQAQGYGVSELEGLRDERPWADLAHALFNLKEFIFLF